MTPGPVVTPSFNIKEELWAQSSQTYRRWWATITIVQTRVCSSLEKGTNGPLVPPKGR